MKLVATAPTVFPVLQETSIKTLLDRGEKLEDLAAQSNDLSMESKVSLGLDRGVPYSHSLSRENGPLKPTEALVPFHTTRQVRVRQASEARFSFMNWVVHGFVPCAGLGQTQSRSPALLHCVMLAPCVQMFMKRSKELNKCCTIL